MRYLRLLCVSFLSVFALISFSQTVEFTYDNDIDSDFKDVYTKKQTIQYNGVDVEDVYVADAGKYIFTGTTYDTSWDNDYDNPFTGSIAIADGATLTATGKYVSEKYYAGLSVLGDIYQTGGMVNAVSGEGTGIFIGGGDFNISGGKTTVTTNGGYGILLENGDFTISGGETKITANDHTGIGIYFGNFTISGGKIIITANTENRGVRLDEGSFNISGGETTVTANSSATGIHLEVGDFVLTGGTLTTNGKSDYGFYDNSYGIFVYDNFILTNGTLITNGTGGDYAEAYGIGLSTSISDFKQNGGIIYANGTGGEGDNAGGYGIVIYNGEFYQNDGTIYAQGQNRGGGIYLNFGTFTQSAPGTLYLMPCTNKGVSVDTYSANLSGTLRPAIDFYNQTNGYFYSVSDITISPLVSEENLVPLLVNSINYDTKNAPYDIIFMKSGSGTIDGAYLQPTKTITMLYKTVISGGNDNEYHLTITRENLVSEVLSGKAAKVARFIENNSAELLYDATSSQIARGFIESYSNVDMSYSVADAEKLFDVTNIMPNTATKRLHSITENWLDIASSTLENRFPVYNSRNGVPLSEDVNNSIWITPLGTVVNFYPDKTLSRALYYGTGFNVGMAGSFNSNDGSSYGISFSYLDGHYDDNNANFGSFGTSFLSSSLGYHINIGQRIWLMTTASFAKSSADAYGDFNKSTSSAYRGQVKGGVNFKVGNWTLTPALGIDYTYYDFGKPIIDTNLIDMKVKNADSLRPTAEIETVYGIGDATSLGLKLGYGYEALGRGIEQEIDLSGVATLSKTERFPRHNSNLSLNVNQSINDVLLFTAEYDLRVNSIMSVNTLKLNFKILY